MKTIVMCLIITILLSGCTGIESGSSPEMRKDPSTGIDANTTGVVDMAQINVSSSAFEHETMIPRKYTCDGDDINPSLEFEGIPGDTKSLVLIVDDPDAPMGTFTHWVVWGIDPGSGIDENSVPGTEGRNDFRKTSYGGPCPPGGTHRYFFTVYALDTELDIRSGADRKEVEKAMEGHIIAKGQLMGKYSR